MQSYVRYLADTLGGKWNYDGVATWWCDDEKRHVSRTASCLCDDDCKHPPHFILYEDGKTPITLRMPEREWRKYYDWDPFKRSKNHVGKNCNP